MSARLRAFAIFSGFAAAACGGPSKPNTDQRLWTDDFEIRVSSDFVPPIALEQIHYTITVRDKKTREPIVGGQGRVFATDPDHHTIYDGFAYGPEVGTYHAVIMFPISGEWAMGVQFRRDSTRTLQRTLDWHQEVRPAAEPGSRRTP